jgi:formylglycine-generating enzyme required for sulfatase activity
MRVTKFSSLEALLQGALDSKHPAGAPHPAMLRDWFWLADQLADVPLPISRPLASSLQVTDVSQVLETLQVSELLGPEQSPSDLKQQPTTYPSQASPALSLPTAFPVTPDPVAPPVERLARLTDPHLLPDEASAADAIPLRLRELPLIPNPGLVLKAMKPLLEKRAHPRWLVLDEEQSAVRSHEYGLPWPVFRQRRVPLISLRIVLDAGLPMMLWEPLARELQRVLASSQAFARVSFVKLDRLCLAARPLESPTDVERTATILLSDTAGEHWWDGSLLPWLQSHSQHHPLAVVHLLPSRYWEATALQIADAVTIFNRVALAGNTKYESLYFSSSPWEEELSATSGRQLTLSVPVISFDHHELLSWASLVTGDPRFSCTGRLFSLPFTELQSFEPKTCAAQDLWKVFIQRASPAARQLLLAMATSPLLTMPVMRLMLASVAPEAFSPQPLAEVLLSGLVHRLPDQEDRTLPLEQVQFEVLPDVQDLLQDKLDPELRHQVLNDVTLLLQRHWDRHHDGESFRALVLGPKDKLKAEHPDLHHIAHLTAAMLDRLPGRAFQEMAAQLRGSAIAPLPPPLWPAAVVFEEYVFDTAQVVDVPPLEVIDVMTARFEVCQLQQIVYETATVEVAVAADDKSEQVSAVSVHRKPGQRAWGFIETLHLASASDIGLTLVQIPKGSFLMGSPTKERERHGAEGPEHEVTLESFFMSQTPVTQAQWSAVAQWVAQPGERWGRELDAFPSHFSGQPDSDLRPVEQVNWLDAMEFCHRLRQRTGRHYTLPSEAQWEYACRAGTTSPFAFGDTITSELANYGGNYRYAGSTKGEYRKQTTPVGAFPANAWGLQDMHGNVWEWCLDHWHDSYEGAPSDGSAWLINPLSKDALTKNGSDDQSSAEEHRLLRGGSWGATPWDCRSASRTRGQPGDAYYNIGFRVVCLPQDPSINT